MSIFKKDDTVIFSKPEVKTPLNPKNVGFKLDVGILKNQTEVLEISDSVYEQNENPRIKAIFELAKTYKETIKKDISNGIAILSDIPDSESENTVKAQIRESVQRRNNLTPDQKEALISIYIDDFIGYGPITALMKDQTINEIMVNGTGQDENGVYLTHEVWIERKGKLRKLNNIFFDDENHVREIINKMAAQAGRRCDENSPMVATRLADGSRINCTIPPVSIDGSSINIRKFNKNRISMDKMISIGTLTKNMAAFLKCCVEARCNIIISGGTGSGKTSLLNALSSYIPTDQRIVTIEDTAELSLQQPHVVRREARMSNTEGTGEITIRDLVINAMRERPDRIIVGECRDKEAFDMLQAMQTGHDGSLTTIHANNPRNVFERLETLCKYADSSLSTESAARQMSAALDLIIHVSKCLDGERRITAISTINGLEGDRILTDTIFEYTQDGKNSKFKSFGIQPTGKVRDNIRKLGVYYNPSWFKEIDDNKNKVKKDMFSLKEL